MAYCCFSPSSSASRTTSKNSVAVVTGCTLETMMPYGRSSYAMARATWACAALLAL